MGCLKTSSLVAAASGHPKILIIVLRRRPRLRSFPSLFLITSTREHYRLVHRAVTAFGPKPFSIFTYVVKVSTNFSHTIDSGTVFVLQIYQCSAYTSSPPKIVENQEFLAAIDELLV